MKFIKEHPPVTVLSLLKEIPGDKTAWFPFALTVFAVCSIGYAFFRTWHG